MIVAFHKPYGVLSQFNPNPDEPGQSTLADFELPNSVVPLGRLDLDSEGLLLLTDERDLVDRLMHPRFRHRRRYLAQVEGDPAEEALERLRQGGLNIRGYRTLPCRVRRLRRDPEVLPRDPPIRERKHIPDAWILLDLREGKNRQVRRMTAAAGYPTLRLIRVGMGRYELGDLPPGKWRILDEENRKQLFARQ